MRSTHPFEQEEVMAYLDGEISADRASEIAQHMQQCAECQELAAGFRNLSQQLAAWDIEMSPERLTEQIDAETASAVKSAEAKVLQSEMTPAQRLMALLRALTRRPWVWVGAGALAMALLVVVAVAVPNFLRAWPAALLAAREMELRELQKRMVQQEVASSIENNQVDERYSPYVEGKAAVPTVPPPPPPPGTPASTAPLIARTASLSLVVKNFAGIEAAVKAVVSRHSGYIGELSTSTPPDAAKTFSAALRVPSAQLEPALAELKQLGRADQESQAGEEVTKQWILRRV